MRMQRARLVTARSSQPSRLPHVDVVAASRSPRLLQPPNPEIVEFSLFGPGYGECAVVHVGQGRWVIVDSCLRVRDSGPVALEYLRSLKINFENVYAVIATHWDDDHVQGLAEVVKACAKAKLWIPEATRLPELAALIEADGMEPRPGIRQLSGIFAELKRRAGTRHPFPGVQLARANMPIHDNQITRQKPSCEIWALSPSDADVHAGFKQLRNLLPSDSNYTKPIGKSSHNEFSIVLHVRVGRQTMLLGADRETGGIGRGWDSVAQMAEFRGLRPSNLLKVPHHGSQTGNHPTIWSMLTRRPLLAVLTPNIRVRGGGLPTRSDIDRLKANADFVAVTSWVTVPGSDDEHIATDPIFDAEDVVIATATGGDGEDSDDPSALSGNQRIIADDAAQPPLGHVRCRAPARGGKWTVELFGPAVQL